MSEYLSLALLQTCHFKSINIFHLEQKMQAFKEMSVVHPKLWLLFVHMQGNINLSLSYW